MNCTIGKIVKILWKLGERQIKLASELNHEDNWFWILRNGDVYHSLHKHLLIATCLTSSVLTGRNIKVNKTKLSAHTV